MTFKEQILADPLLDTVKELAKILLDKGISIEMEADHNYFKEHRQLKYTDMPYINSGISSGLEHFYFRHGGFDNYCYETVSKLFPMTINEHTISLVDVIEMEEEDDRIRQASLHFKID